MNDKEIKLYLTLVYTGVVVSVILLVLDYKLKADVIAMLKDIPGAGGAKDSQPGTWANARFDGNVTRIPAPRFSPGEGEEEDAAEAEAWLPARHPDDDGRSE
jgi:aminoglycoside phosphotransferase (APT) family kinase protein